ncbi:hypothetical protein IE077_001906 [Cardiosporidium cionae]|uniref:Uncharacterized protein n=1 Tax=Cardiosporidium cionae TaxID=476202 RepID=A0ABQ7JCD3_9APIC|nr:hypothetical protein IE077_001906 [Cardiosporidium cionae]|eukprot:KAF8821549.1 hypothetical protein IE077_001906 [Cardiosporidium cionae]
MNASTSPTVLTRCSHMNWDGCPLKIYVINTGMIKARFSVEVPRCFLSNTSALTTDIEPFNPVGGIISMGEDGVFTLIVKVATFHGGNYSCIAQLFDAVHNLMDKKLFYINVDEIAPSFQGFQRRIAPVFVNLTGSSLVSGKLTPSNIDKYFQGRQSQNLTGAVRAQCKCGINIFCIIREFSQCVAKLLNWIIPVISIFAFVAATICFLPLCPALLHLVSTIPGGCMRLNREIGYKISHLTQAFKNPQQTNGLEVKNCSPIQIERIHGKEIAV